MRTTSGLTIPLEQLKFFLNEGHNMACRGCWALRGARPSFVPPFDAREQETQRTPQPGPLPAQEPQCTPQPGPLPAQELQRTPQSGPLPAHDLQRAPLSPVLVEQALREAAPLGLRAVTLTGGEPLLHPAFDALVDLLARHAVNITLETGGQGLTPQRAARLARTNRASVSLGLEGADAATHDRLNGTPGAFAAAAAAARALSDAGVPTQVVFPLVRENAGQLAGVVRLAEQLGARSVRFLLVSRADGCEREALSVEELIALGRRVERDLAPATRLRLHYDQPAAFRGLNPQGPIQPHRRCEVLNSISVLPGGIYALCGLGTHAARLLFGRVGAVPLEEIWREHPLLLHLREGIPHRLEGVCQRCVLKNNCLGSCVVQNFVQRGSFWGPFWFCEAAERARLFPAHRLSEQLH